MTVIEYTVVRPLGVLTVAVNAPVDLALALQVLTSGVVVVAGVMVSETSLSTVTAKLAILSATLEGAKLRQCWVW